LRLKIKMARDDFYKIDLACKRRNLLKGIESAGGYFLLGEKEFMRILRKGIVDGPDTAGQTTKSLFRFYRKAGMNPLSAYFVAREEISLLRERAINDYLGSIFREISQFREINGPKGSFFVEARGIGVKIIRAYQEERDSTKIRSLYQKFEDLIAFRDSESGNN